MYARSRYEQNGERERELQRERMIRSRYGVEPVLIELLYEQQEGCCAICARAGGHPTRGERTFGANTLSIDHNHTTGEFRGLICKSCNSGLGHFGDSPRRLVNALAYLLDRGGQ